MEGRNLDFTNDNMHIEEYYNLLSQVFYSKKVNSISATKNLEGSSNLSSGKFQVAEGGHKLTTGDFEVEEGSSNLITESFHMEKASSCSTTEQNEILDSTKQGLYEASGRLLKAFCIKTNNILNENVAFVKDLYEYVYTMRNLSDETKRKTVKPQTESPFTESIRSACKIVLTTRGTEMYMVWKIQLLTVYENIILKNVCEKAIENFWKRPFCPKVFLVFYLVMCNHAALYYNYGIELAPSIVTEALQRLLHKIRREVDTTEDFWKRLEVSSVEMQRQIIAERH